MIKILTRKEARHTEERSKRFNEYFSALIGRAKRDFVCDNSKKAIPKGSLCVACVVLPSYDYKNITKQKKKLHDLVE